MRQLLIIGSLLVSCAAPKSSPPLNTAPSDKAPREEAKPQKEPSKADANNAPGGPAMQPTLEANIASSSITFGKIESKGALSTADITKTFERSMSGLEFCYGEGRQSNPTLSGKINISFVVGVDGSVSGVATKDSFSRDLEQCIEKKVAQMKFPAYAEKTEVSFPLLFNVK